MTDKMMDDLFRDKLERHASEVPAGTFDSIMAARERKRRRPAGYWYLLPAAVLIGGGIFLGSRHQSRTDAPDMANPLVKQDGKSTTNPQMAEPTTSDDGSAAKTQDAINPITKSSAADKNYTLNDFSSTQGNKIVSHPDASTSVSPSNKGSGFNNQKGAYALNSHGSEKAPSDQRDESGALIGHASDIGSGNISATTSVLKNLSFPTLGQALNQTRSPLVPFDPNMASTQRFCIPPCGIPGCPDFREYRNDWYLEAFGSADMPFKTLQGTTGKTDFVPHKDSTERMLLSYSAGLRVSKNLTNNLLLKTGFHYSQINERFDYKNESERKIVTVITIRTVIRGPGDTLLVRDTSQVETVGVRTKRTYNKYRNIDVPLILSYELRKPDFTIGLNGGLLFNVRSTFQGDMLDTSLVPMSQTAKAPASQIKTNWGLGLYAGVSFIKPIGPSTDLFAEPWYRVYLKNAAADDAPFQQKMSAWGLQVGLRYRFNHGGQR